MLKELGIKTMSETLQLLNYPKTLPFQAACENMDKLKEWLLDQFARTVFNNIMKFLALSGCPAQLHLKGGSISKARHNLIPVPYHFKEQV